MLLLVFMLVLCFLLVTPLGDSIIYKSDGTMKFKNEVTLFSFFPFSYVKSFHIPDIRMILQLSC